jgi:phosphotransferase system, enzyme I, PtsP
MENIELIHHISDIIINADSHGTALQKVVDHLRRFMESDVCSIYLYNPSKHWLMLTATAGLREESVGRVKMKPNEGLTGLAFVNDGCLIVNEATQHQQFKYFPGIGEEPFNTFIGIPLKNHRAVFGVLVFQFKENRQSTPMMIKLLSTVASVVSGLVLKFNLLDITEEQESRALDLDQVFTGIALSDGIAIGRPVHVIYNYIESNQEVFDPESEIRDLAYAFDMTRIEISELIQRIEESEEKIGSEIFHGHLMMLQDGTFRKDMIRHIQQYNKGAAFSIRHVSDKFIRKFRAIPDPYLRERAADIEDICERLLTNLGVLQKDTELHDNSIVISESLTPGETASLDMEKVCGFITSKDGPTSHTAILARSRRIPAVSGIPNLLERTEATRTIIVDGFEGQVIVNPSAEMLAEYRRRQHDTAPQPAESMPVLTIDADLTRAGVHLLANVSSVLDASKAHSLNADGIGLVRTEIFYLQKQGEFDFATQLDIYQRIVDAFPGGPIVFRLLDIGADKKSRREIREENPALGLRGLRLLLADPDLLREQVRALLTVSAEPSLKLLIPFITEIDEYRQTAELIRREAAAMHRPVPSIGAMVEIPSAVFFLEELAEEADFISVGTNDLFQYCYAVDRNNPYVSNLYQLDSPAFMRLLAMIFERTRQSGREVEVCGEIAADPVILNRLLDIGYRRFSINPYSIQTTRLSLLQRFGN